MADIFFFINLGIWTPCYINLSEIAWNTYGGMLCTCFYFFFFVKLSRIRRKSMYIVHNILPYIKYVMTLKVCLYCYVFAIHNIYTNTLLCLKHTVSLSTSKSVSWDFRESENELLIWENIRSTVWKPPTFHKHIFPLSFTTRWCREDKHKSERRKIFPQ